MKLLDILTSPWAIVPEKLFEIRDVYLVHMRGEKIDIKGIETRMQAGVEKKKGERYDIIDGTAIIPIMDVITKHMTFWSFFFGGTSSAEVGRILKDALVNPEVKSILLNIDSPGGTVDGTQELADLIYAARGQKPIISYTDGMMASAAYYIGSAADAVYISGDMPNIGSIGVVTEHIDYSKHDEKLGIKRTEIYAGKYKRIGSTNEPLSEDGKEYLQDIVDYTYSIFVNDVAKYRGISIEKALEMADGKIFIGKQAIEVGLVDGVSTFDRLVDTVLPVMQAERADAQALAELNNSLRKELYI